MLEPGCSRQRLARTLNAGFAEGLISERTLAHRLDLLLSGPVVDPARLVGDLTRHVPRHNGPHAVLAALASALRLGESRDAPSRLLALDWTGSQAELLIGRNPECDVLIEASTVSRRHARLLFRDGGWILQDLQSKNGTVVNGVRVGRCRLCPGDELRVADQLLQVD